MLDVGAQVGRNLLLVMAVPGGKRKWHIAETGLERHESA